MSDQPQCFENHARTVPMFHYFALPVLSINAIWSIYRLTSGVSFDSVLNVLVAFSLAIVAVYARVFALGAQDRVIRLEMRLRMRQILPRELQPQIDDFTPAQMVGLRFAGDGELPDLARKVLGDNLASPTPIKKLVKDWQPDLFRI